MSAHTPSDRQRGEPSASDRSHAKMSDAERDRELDKLLARVRSFRFTEALVSHFNDGAPKEWTHAVLVARFDPATGEIASVEIEGPRGGPPYGTMSSQFVESFADLAQYNREFGNKSARRWALRRPGKSGTSPKWNVIPNPDARFMRYVMKKLGHRRWDPATDEFLGPQGES